MDGMNMLRGLGAVALSVVLLGGSRMVLNQTGICLANMQWKDEAEYKSAAVRYAISYNMPLIPSISKQSNANQTANHIAQNPQCCQMGKQGFSEYDPPDIWDRLTGRASKTVSLSTGSIPDTNMIGYVYIIMNNCGVVYERAR